GGGPLDGGEAVRWEGATQGLGGGPPAPPPPRHGRNAGPLARRRHDLVPAVQPRGQLQVAQLVPQDPLFCSRERTQPHLWLDTSPPPRHATPPRGKDSEEAWED